MSKYGFKSFVFCDSHSELVDNLCKAGSRYFDNIYELFTLAACIGYSKGRKSKVEKAGKKIEFNQLRSFENFDGIFLSICLAHSKESSILKDDDETITSRMTIFSEYANGGMEILKKEVNSNQGDFQENLIQYIQDNGVHFKEFKEKTTEGTSKYKHLLEGL